MDKVELWPFIQNFFENRTKGSFKVTDVIVEDHQDKLVGSTAPFAVALAALWQPYYTSWKGAWNAWRSATNTWHSCTRALENLLRELLVSPGGEGRSRLDDWESRIAGQWPVSSEFYRHFFPLGRDEFTTGAREATIQAVLALSTRLSEKVGQLQQAQNVVQLQVDALVNANQPVPPELQRELNKAIARVTVVTEVSEEANAFHGQLNTARGEQQLCEGRVDTTATELEKQRVRVCRRLFKNFHFIAEHYMDTESAAANPQYAAAGFFDLDVLMRPKSEDPPDDGPDNPPPAPPTP